MDAAMAAAIDAAMDPESEPDSEEEEDEDVLEAVSRLASRREGAAAGGRGGGHGDGEANAGLALHMVLSCARAGAIHPQSRLLFRLESHQERANMAPRRMSPRTKTMTATMMPTARIATPVRAKVMVTRRRPPPALRAMRAWALV
jgi:hypothetical protein